MPADLLLDQHAQRASNCVAVRHFKIELRQQPVYRAGQQLREELVGELESNGIVHGREMRQHRVDLRPQGCRKQQRVWAGEIRRDVSSERRSNDQMEIDRLTYKYRYDVRHLSLIR